jgi:hypothetical protein
MSLRIKKPSQRTVRIIGASFVLIQFVAVAVMAVASIIGLGMKGVGFIAELMVLVDAICFFILIVGVAALLLWAAIKNRNL